MNSLVKPLCYLITLILTGYGCAGGAAGPEEMLVSSEFIYDTKDVPFPNCHASTICETSKGLVCAWFGGTHEKNPDVGIWLSRQLNGQWTRPVEVANGVVNDSLRFPTWNPVLFLVDGHLMLFFKKGPNPREWWGEMMVSEDNGKTWPNPMRLPEGILGPDKNKPVLIDNQRLLCPSSTEQDGWVVHMEITSDMGKTWQRTEALNHKDSVLAIQPSILQHVDGRLQMLCRSQSHRICTSWSTDGGYTWSNLVSSGLPSNNSGIDAVTLHDGRSLLVYNHIDRSVSEDRRNRLHVAISEDGIEWSAVMVLENDPDTGHEYSYPAVIQTEDGYIHITYTWRRELIKHVVIDPSKIISGPITAFDKK